MSESPSSFDFGRAADAAYGPQMAGREGSMSAKASKSTCRISLRAEPLGCGLVGIPKGNTFMRMLVMVFNREGLAHAAASVEKADVPK